MDNTDLSQYKKLYFDTAKDYTSQMRSKLNAVHSDSPDTSFEDLHRFAHSLKSQSIVMKFDDIARLSGILEDIFEKLQSGKKKPSKDLLEELKHAAQILTQAIQHLEKGKQLALQEEIQKLNSYNT